MTLTNKDSKIYNLFFNMNKGRFWREERGILKLNKCRYDGLIGISAETYYYVLNRTKISPFQRTKYRKV